MGSIESFCLLGVLFCPMDEPEDPSKGKSGNSIFAFGWSLPGIKIHSLADFENAGTPSVTPPWRCVRNERIARFGCD